MNPSGADHEAAADSNGLNLRFDNKAGRERGCSQAFRDFVPVRARDAVDQPTPVRFRARLPAVLSVTLWRYEGVDLRLGHALCGLEPQVHLGGHEPNAIGTYMRRYVLDHRLQRAPCTHD